ncbi:MAG TPA: HAD-IA family hydrolase, partial [Rhodocyclaceae bacterium]|nr:HAD-IA family hydrolase [Rhodocyclaceae bacterium]
KPSLTAFRALLRAEKLQTANCIMVEDSLLNLVSAKKLGLKTVWVSAGSRASPYVDVKLRSLRDLPRRLGWL